MATIKTHYVVTVNIKRVDLEDGRATSGQYPPKAIPPERVITDVTHVVHKATTLPVAVDQVTGILNLVASAETEADQW